MTLDYAPPTSAKHAISVHVLLRMLGESDRFGMSRIAWIEGEFLTD
jgi:hypothetical protein